MKIMFCRKCGQEVDERLDIDCRNRRHMDDVRSLSQEQAIRYAIAQILVGECLGRGMMALGEESSCVVLWKSTNG